MVGFGHDPQDKVNKGQINLVSKPTHDVLDNSSRIHSWNTDDIFLQTLDDGLTNQVASAAFILLAIIQAKTLSLSMYHALIILNLPGLLTLAMYHPIPTAIHTTTRPTDT